MPTPSQNLRPLSTADRFTMLVDHIIELAPAYGYTAGNIPSIVIAQAALETQRFTSDLLLRADNAFGMRIAGQRPQPWLIGITNGYAMYNTLEDSVRDYFDRQRAQGIPNTDDADAYINATVASGYATASAYGETWRDLLEQVAATDYATAFRLSDDVSGPPVATASMSLGLVLLLAICATQLK